VRARVSLRSVVEVRDAARVVVGWAERRQMVRGKSSRRRRLRARRRQPGGVRGAWARVWFSHCGSGSFCAQRVAMMRRRRNKRCSGLWEARFPRLATDLVVVGEFARVRL
jgi:hypothetical protein